MTKTSDRAQARRISSIRDAYSWLEMIQKMAKTTDLSPEVLEAIDQKTLSIGDAAGWYLVTPYVIKHGRSVLYEELCKRGPPDGYEAAELFKFGYGGADAEQRLCERLYEIYPDDANPLKSEIVKAMEARGGEESLELLEDIRFELDPKLKTAILVARSIAQFDQVDMAQLGKVKATEALVGFAELVDSAVLALRARVAKLVAACQIAPPSLPGSMDASLKGRHSRLVRVERHLSKAKALVLGKRPAIPS